MIEQVLLRCFKRSSVFLMAAVLSVSMIPTLALAESASELLELSGIKGGLVVHLGCGDGKLTAQLRAGDQYFVHGSTRTPVKSLRRENISWSVICMAL